MKIFEHILTVAILTILYSICVSCMGDDSSPESKIITDSDEAETVAEETIQEDVNETEEDNTERDLDVTSDDVTTFSVSSYFSPHKYGPTQKLYIFKDRKSILKIRIDNQSVDFDVTVEINIFAKDATEQSIDRWINNQHSDGIYIDAAKPIEVYTLPDTSYSVLSYALTGHDVGPAADEYDNYNLEIFIDNVFEVGAYYLKSFVAETTVYIRTKDAEI